MPAAGALLAAGASGQDDSALTAVFVILIAVVGLVIGFLLVGRSRSGHDDIGGGIFDRPRGDTGERPPPDAEHDEFVDALDLVTEDPAPREESSPGDPPSSASD